MPETTKAKQLVEVAQNSMGLTEGLVMAKFEIATFLSQIKLMQAQLIRARNGDLTIVDTF